MSPVIVSIGSFEIRWYSVLMLVAIFIGLFLIKKEAQRLNLKYDFIFNMCFWAIIVGYICSRLSYVLFNLEYYGLYISTKLLVVPSIVTGCFVGVPALCAGWQLFAVHAGTQ